MGYKTSSTRRTTAASAISSQAVVINSGNATVVGTTPTFGVSGSSIKADTVISLNVVTAGQNTATSTTTVSSGPVISNIAYLDTNNAVASGLKAVSTAGGNILITGSGFVANSNVYVNNTLVANTLISSTQIRATLPSGSNGNVNLFMFTPTNTGGLSPISVRYSGTPSWTTTFVGLANNSLSNVSLVASSDSTLTYTLQAGSTLPTGMSLNSAGYIVGTPTGYTSDTTFTPVIIATDQEGQAAQQTVTILVGVSDQYFPYVSVVTKTTGTNAATNSVFLDSSGNSVTITPAGPPAQGTFSPFSPTGWSNYFTGGADVLTINGNAGPVGTEDFTWECWAFISVMGGNYPRLFESAVGTTGSFQVYLNNGGFTVAGNGTGNIVSYDISALTNQWLHLCITRTGSAMRMFVNGVLRAYSASGGTNFVSSASWKSATEGGGIVGYLSNMRVVRGSVVSAYSTASTTTGTTIFTPPIAPLTAISGTQFLGMQSNRFRDVSTNAYTITPTGAPTVQAFSPFPGSSSWSAAVHGGSAYFSGTPWIAFSQPALTSVFTIESWLYFPAVNSDKYLYVGSGATSGPLIRLDSTGGTMSIGRQGGFDFTVSTPYPIGQWFHFALVREGTGVGQTKVYFNGALAGSGQSTTTFNAGAVGLGSTETGGQAITGYMSGWRMVPGTAVYTGAFTPPTAPPTAISGTGVLLNFTNAGIYDAHSTHNLTTFGGAQVSTARAKYATASLVFNGSNSYVTSQPTPTYTFGTGDFTVEFWLNFTATANRQDILDWYVSAADRGGIKWNVTAGRLTYYISPTVANAIDVVWTPSTNTWYHIALVRSSGVSKFYIDGVGQTPTYNDSRNYSTSTYSLHLGKDSAAASSWVNGYLEDVRVTRGFARYTANFTPPAIAFAGQ